ncbi:MAG: serine hydroxymethyltransferase [Thermodesulfobacteriota bacterium]
MYYEKSVAWVEQIVAEQNEWRSHTINLIASENVLSRRARRVMGSDFAHRYAEGHPGERYYQGTDKIDEIETRVKKHLKTLFRCRQVDVRPISGTVCNDAVFSQYIKPGDIVMVNSTSAGGHISHHKAGSVGKYTRNIIDFPLTRDGYHIDTDKAVELIRTLRPTVLIFGKSLFLFPEPVSELARTAKGYGALIIYDAAHVLGLVAGRRFQDPLGEGADVMTASTHKTFPGPQRGVALSNMKDQEWKKIDKGAFPGSSSNHHLDTLVPLSITAYEMLEMGEAYAEQTIRNAKALAHSLHELGFDVQAEEFDFTESHQIAVDVNRFGRGDEVARMLKDNNIILNMNLLPFEPLENVTNPAGVRIGVQEMTRVGMKEPEMKQIAVFFRQCMQEGRYVGDEVTDFRSQFQDVLYSFDDRDGSPCSK